MNCGNVFMIIVNEGVAFYLRACECFAIVNEYCSLILGVRSWFELSEVENRDLCRERALHSTNEMIVCESVQLL